MKDGNDLASCQSNDIHRSIYSNEQGDRIVSLDILRSIAILMVIAVHMTQAFPTQVNYINQIGYLGRFGVQLFFLVSAFTMCLMWDSRADEKKKILKFYVRRFLRIFPIYVLFVPIYILIFGTGVTHWLPNGVEMKHLISNLTLTHSLWPDTVGGIVHGGWSISVEALFYLIFPALAIIIIRSSALAASVIAALVFSIYSTSYNLLFNVYKNAFPELELSLIEDFLYLNFCSQFFVFLVGIALYHSRKYLVRDRIILSALPVLCALPIFLLNWISAKSLGFCVIVFGLSVLFVSISTFQKSIKGLGVLFRLLSAIGKRSYGMYIMHFIIISFLPGGSYESLTSISMLLFLFCFTVLASYISANYIEGKIDILVKIIKMRFLWTDST